jgi:nucleotide-binding universal stress UspA family protein
LHWSKAHGPPSPLETVREAEQYSELGIDRGLFSTGTEISTMNDRILVAVDGSDGASAATTYALAVATAGGATLDAVHVLDTGGPIASLLDDESAAEDRARDLLDDAATRAGDAGVPVETHLRRGSVETELLETASEQGADLLVLGRHGTQSVRERLLGGTTDAVLRHADRPVLTVQGSGPTAVEDVVIDRLLVPTDGSEHGEAATEPAAELAARLDASIEIVSVVDLQAEAGPFDAGGVAPEFVESLEERADQAVASAADAVADAQPDLAVETSVTQGRAAETLATRTEEADLVVMGRTGRSGLADGLLGSVTDRLLRAVEQPVLVVPA